MSQSIIPLTFPGRGKGLRDVYKNRFLLKLLVSKEIKVRYRGSILGILWSYMRPLMQFVVFYLALGLFLNVQGSTPNYPIYLFAGIVLVNFFTEALGNATRSIVENRDLIRKIYLPRELFPVASVWVSAVHFLPQVLILLVVCLFNGWHPSLWQLAAVLIAFAMLAILAVGLGLFFGAINVYFRDSENLVDLLIMMVTWLSPVLYLWSQVEHVLGPFFWIYQLNPMTVAVEIFHNTFWHATLNAEQAASPAAQVVPGLDYFWLPIGLGISLAVLFIGQFTFGRLSKKFAQEL
ncbi:ABC transporter permease [Psychromicrobium lacuslunae]|uniref:Transport permease protein n=1 Tax=Psychromicrobium lacuslunae TaxID=1618207 RepID=A0A0D4BZ79_9MICC|nr:ABC transporter permease [Psychromicrobium lacuslunae]AJT41426.1 sugar ABC transporter permease [Psychromicrobium lacuslunae]